MNTEYRKSAKSGFEEDFFKLLNNSLYGKLMQNLHKQTQVCFVSDDTAAEQQLSKHTCVSWNEINDRFSIVHQRQARIYWNKPTIVGFTILELSNYHMYCLYYHYFSTYVHYCLSFSHSLSLSISVCLSVCLSLSLSLSIPFSLDLSLFLYFFDLSCFRSPHIHTHTRTHIWKWLEYPTLSWASRWQSFLVGDSEFDSQHSVNG